ncbi:MAG TPA: zinc-ribbon domain-containing protein, partial [Polyangiales bacterium]|nr:zinc-ribbon domain-containing protein [Polyangiales bacterium]
MAFCPECGKSATAEATRCIHCGHELPVVEKKAGGGRFKGTMMMAQPVATAPASAANANSAGFTRDVTPMALAPEAQPTVAAAKPAPKANVKATMIGQGIGPLIAQQAAAAAPIASANVAESAQQVGY